MARRSQRDLQGPNDFNKSARSSSHVAGEDRREIRPVRSRHPRSRRRWLLGLAFLVVAPLVTLAALPQLVRVAGIRNQLIAWSIPELAGHVQVGNIAAGWFTPITIENVVVTDLDGGTLVQVPRVVIQQGLWNWAFDALNGAKDLRVEGPILSLVLYDDGSSNVQRLTAKLPTRSSTAGSDQGSVPRLRVEVTGASLVASQSQGTIIHWQDIEGLVVTEAEIAKSTIEVKGTAKSLTPEGHDGTFALTVNRLVQDASQAPDGLAVERVSPALLVARDVPWQWWLDGTSRVTGSVGVDLKADLTTAENLIRVDGKVDVDSTAGNSEATFSVPLAPWIALCQQFTLSNLLKTAAAPGDLDLKAEIPLEQWARMSALQATLRGTDLQGAPLQLAVLSGLSPRGERTREMQVRVQVGPGQIMHGSVPFAWKDPMRLEINAASVDGQVWVQKLTCHTPFLLADGSGSPQAMQASFQGDLARVVQHFHSFLPAAIPYLEGQFVGEAKMLRASSDGGTAKWQTDGHATVQSLKFGTERGQTWQERQLRLRVHGMGGQAADAFHVAELDCQIEFDAGDRVVAKLLEPVAIRNGQELNSTWELTAQGDLTRWQNRSQAWLALPLELAGTGLIRTKLAQTVSGVKLSECTMDWQRCQIRSGAWNWQEPRVQASLQGSLQWLPHVAFHWDDLAATSSAIAMRARGGEVRWDPQLATEGQMQFRGILERLAAWSGIATPVALPASWGDQLDGKLAWNTEPAGVQWKLETTTSSKGTTTTNPLGIAANGLVNPETLAFRVDDLRAKLPGLDMNAKTQIAASSPQTQQFKVVGTTQYVLEQLVPLQITRAWGLSEIRGTHTGKFSLEFPWQASSNAASSRIHAVSASAPAIQTSNWSSTARGEVQAGWDAARFLDLAVGSGNVKANLADGLIRFDRIETHLGDGSLSVHPLIDVRSTEPTVSLQSPAQLNRLRLTPEICRSYLKYLAPLVADVADSRGVFSVAVAAARLPAYHPAEMAVDGQLVIHEAQIGPGALSQQILSAIQTVRQLARGGGGETREGTGNWLNLPEQTIQWRVSDGRVYHEGLTVQIGDVVMKTRGWVAMDDSLQLVVEVPVQAGWVESKPWLKSLAGTSIQLPVTGTLRRPLVDQRGLAQMGTQALQGAAQDAVRSEVQKQLLRLFDKK